MCLNLEIKSKKSEASAGQHMRDGVDKYNLCDIMLDKVRINADDFCSMAIELLNLYWP